MNELETGLLRMAINLGWRALIDMNKVTNDSISRNDYYNMVEEVASALNMDIRDIWGQ